MCGRFTRFKSWQEVHDALCAFLGELRQPNDYVTSYNVAPTQDVLAIAGGRTGAPARASMVRWGLVPFWAKEIPRGSMFNARADTVAEKPAFRTAWERGMRCLVVADGYYEWHTEDGAKQPYRIHLPDQPVFCFAGLWAHNDALDVTSCTIITTEAAPSIAHLHPRMPVILQPEDLVGWLSRDTALDEARHMLQSPARDGLEAYPVGRAVGNVSNDSPELVERAA